VRSPGESASTGSARRSRSPPSITAVDAHAAAGLAATHRTTDTNLDPSLRWRAEPHRNASRAVSAEFTPHQGQSAYHLKMNATHFRYLIAGGVLAASAILGAPTALAQPDNPVNCVTDPTNSACLAIPGLTPNSPGQPVSPNDLRCIAQPGNGVCAGGPYALTGTIPGAPPDPRGTAWSVGQ